MLDIMLQLNWWVATGTLVLELVLVGKLFSLLVLSTKNNELKKSFLVTVYGSKQKVFQSFGIDILSEKFLLLFIFLLSLFSTVISLIYSEIFLQVPCSLCWWQRIFIYGVTFISGVSLFARNNMEEKGILRYVLTFSVGGLLVGLYQHVQQISAMYGTSLPCPVSGADCSKMTLFEYGHITFPWLSVVLCGFIIVTIFLQKKLNR